MLCLPFGSAWSFDLREAAPVYSALQLVDGSGLGFGLISTYVEQNCTGELPARQQQQQQFFLLFIFLSPTHVH